MKKVGSTRGLGARYGSTVRKRYVKVITELKKPHRCPQCGFVRVHRVSVGVWKCNKCSYTYAGGAYTPLTKLGVIAKRSAKGAVEDTPKTTAPTVETTTVGTAIVEEVE
ncbi:MAG: 50S ribosomal protein L37ae [Nitrososphaerota archaeon]|jgi:large subunit ribosomal protein L37Ae|nr:50S ribosomal protein L37ae [Nitrososphaerota archaeon]